MRYVPPALAEHPADGPMARLGEAIVGEPFVRYDDPGRALTPEERAAFAGAAEDRRATAKVLRAIGRPIRT